MAKYYTAYGSNLNFRQMKMRCPTAKFVGTGTIEDYELQFKGRPFGAHATIAPCPGASVPVGVWKIQAGDERALDFYEGYPNYYFKEQLPVKVDGRERSTMVYIMDLKQDFGIPSRSYFETIAEGYRDCGLDENVLYHSLNDAVMRQRSVLDRQQERAKGDPCTANDAHEVKLS